jgi:hypothetical protein
MWTRRETQSMSSLTARDYKLHNYFAYLGDDEHAVRALVALVHRLARRVDGGLQAAAHGVEEERLLVVGLCTRVERHLRVGVVIARRASKTLPRNTVVYHVIF